MVSPKVVLLSLRFSYFARHYGTVHGKHYCGSGEGFRESPCVNVLTWTPVPLWTCRVPGLLRSRSDRYSTSLKFRSSLTRAVSLPWVPVSSYVRTSANGNVTVPTLRVVSEFQTLFREVHENFSVRKGPRSHLGVALDVFKDLRPQRDIHDKDIQMSVRKPPTGPRRYPVVPVVDSYSCPSHSRSSSTP